MRRALLGLAPIIAIAIAVIVLTWDHSETETADAAGFGPPIMALFVKAGGTGSCDSNEQTAEKCLIEKGSQFTLSVEVKVIPPLGYGGFNSLVTWSGQPTKTQLNYIDSEIVWPDMFPPSGVTLLGQNGVQHGGLTAPGPPFPASFYKGNLVDIVFECKPGTEEENIKFDLISYNDDNDGSLLLREYGGPEPVPPASLKIACVQQATPTPTDTATVTITPTATVNQTPTPAIPPAVSALCVPVVGPEDPLKCKYDLFQSFTITGNANFAQDTDKNDTAGYHGVDVQVTWPSGLGDVEKSSDMFCPPGGQAGKAPILETGKWGGSCGLQTQEEPEKIPDCPTQPDLPFPDAGCDTFDSYGAFDITLTNPALGALHCEVSGATQVTRSSVVQPGLFDMIWTEIVYMHLTGLCDGSIPITVVESAVFQSSGHIEEQKNNIDGTLEFPATSYFEVYVEVQTPLGTFHNQDPIQMKCKIDGIPPYLCAYGSINTPQLFDDTKKVVGTIEHSEHTPKKTVAGPSTYEIELTCVEVGTYTVTVSATFTREAKDTVGPVFDSVDINCNAPGKQAWPFDTDGDGCADMSENRPKPDLGNGGGRDYLNPWDYYDVDGDGDIDLFGDILGVIQHFSLDGLGQYDVIYDRGPSPGPPANPWDMTAPDGVINLFTDILGVITQFTLKGCTDPGSG